MRNKELLNEKAAILEAVLRKKVKAPMAMPADASSEQEEKHIQSTAWYLLMASTSIIGERGEDCFLNVSEEKSDALMTKAFDSAVTKACCDWLLKYIENQPKGLADFNMEQHGSIYPFRNESNCDLVDDAFIKRISYDIRDLFDANFKALQTVLDMGIKCEL